MTTVENAPPRGQGLAGALEILRRRKALALVPFGFVLAATVSLAFFLPSLWTAQAVIMIDRQQIPEAFVKPTVTNDVESRLLTLSQDILSRTRLLEIIKRHNLYPKQRAQGMPDDDIVDTMRKDIRIATNDDQSQQQQNRNSRDTKTVAFSVAYTTTHPGVAMQVANTLADLYVAQNIKLREAQAVGTSDFLQGQLTEVRKKLAAQEQQIAAYKEKYMGELPEQRDANLRTLDRLQQQLAMATDVHRRAIERQQMITQSLAELEQTSPGSTTAGSLAPPPGSDAARLTLLRQELAQLQTKYSDKYPDVVYTKEQIRLLEAKVAADNAANALPKQDAKKKPGLVAPQNSYVQSLMSQLDQANVEIKAGTQEIAGLQRDIALYQKRLDVMPRREHEYAVLTRDYDTTRDLFKSLLAKRDEAGIAADLEQHQKGEAFRIMDPATIPDHPTGPNRVRLLLVGLALALGASGAAVVLAENVDTAYRRVDDVRSRVTIPVLSTIPKITTESDLGRVRRQRRLATAGVALALFVVIGSAYALAHDNEALVSLLTPDPSKTTSQQAKR